MKNIEIQVGHWKKSAARDWKTARYKNEKKDFYYICTKEYAMKYLKVSKEIYLWLRKNYPKK